mmetsp:Transcript_10475/g.27849  ORF Transcript_10475/g.27849 Transcript_10475/m.27849 type:complete len:305 (-) Transcript_10475:104-1018(-)
MRKRTVRVLVQPLATIATSNETEHGKLLLLLRHLLRPTLRGPRRAPRRILHARHAVHHRLLVKHAQHATAATVRLNARRALLTPRHHHARRTRPATGLAHLLQVVAVAHRQQRALRREAPPELLDPAEAAPKLLNLLAHRRRDALALGLKERGKALDPRVRWDVELRLVGFAMDGPVDAQHQRQLSRHVGERPHPPVLADQRLAIDHPAVQRRGVRSQRGRQRLSLPVSVARRLIERRLARGPLALQRLRVDIRGGRHVRRVQGRRAKGAQRAATAVVVIEGGAAEGGEVEGGAVEGRLQLKPA